MKNAKKAFKSSLVYVGLAFLPPAVNFFLAPIYAKELTTDQFGVITLASLCINFLVNIVGLGNVGAFSRYYYEYMQDRKQLKTLFSTAILTNVFSGLLLSLLLWPSGQFILDFSFKNNAFTFQAYGLFVIITAVCSNMQNIIQAFYRNDEKVTLYSIWSVLFFLAVVVSIYTGVVLWKEGAVGSIGGRMWGMFVPTIVFLLIFLISNGVHFSWKMARQMLQYGWPLVFYLTLTLAFNNVDKFMVERYFDLSSLGIYGFAYLIATVMEIFLNAISSAVNPQIFRLLKNEDAPSLNEINKIVSVVIISVLLILVSLATFSGPLIHLFIDPKYHQAILYMPLLLMGYIPRLYFVIYNVPLLYYHKTKSLPWVSGLSLIVSIVFSLLLLPYFGLYGICFSVFLTRSVQCVFAWKICKKFNILPGNAFNIKNSLPIAFFLVVAILVCTWLQTKVHPPLNVWIMLPVMIIAVGWIVWQYKNAFRTVITTILKKR